MSRQKKGDVEFSDDYSKIEIPTSLKNDALKNIFEAAGRQPNTIPVEILELKAHKQSHAMHLIALIAVCLFAVLLLTAVPVFVRSCGSSTGTVQNVDVSKPVHVGDYKNGSDLVIQLRNGTYPIDWTGIYALTSDGTKITPTALDEESGTVTFPLDLGDLNIYIPDTKGNVLQLLLSAK